MLAVNADSSLHHQGTHHHPHDQERLSCEPHFPPFVFSHSLRLLPQQDQCKRQSIRAKREIWHIDNDLSRLLIQTPLALADKAWSSLPPVNHSTLVSRDNNTTRESSLRLLLGRKINKQQERRQTDRQRRCENARVLYWGSHEAALQVENRRSTHTYM